MRMSNLQDAFNYHNLGGEKDCKKRNLQLKSGVIYLPLKGQLISELNFGVFKSPIKPTNFYQDFYPILVEFCWLFGGLKTPKIHSELN